MSSYLYLFCVEGLLAILQKKIIDRAIHGIKASYHRPKLSHLFFSYDSLLFFRASKGKYLIIPDCLKSYKKTMGQRINLHKFRIILSPNTSQNVRGVIQAKLFIRSINAHNKYLSLSAIIRKSKKAQFIVVKERIWKKN